MVDKLALSAKIDSWTKLVDGWFATSTTTTTTKAMMRMILFYFSGMIMTSTKLEASLSSIARYSLLFNCVCACVCVLCVCVCVRVCECCVCAFASTQNNRQKEREREREWACACVCLTSSQLHISNGQFNFGMVVQFWWRLCCGDWIPHSRIIHRNKIMQWVTGEWKTRIGTPQKNLQGMASQIWHCFILQAAKHLIVQDKQH